MINANATTVVLGRRAVPFASVVIRRGAPIETRRIWASLIRLPRLGRIATQSLVSPGTRAIWGHPIWIPYAAQPLPHNRQE